MDPAELQAGDVVKRHRLSTRLWHWITATTMLVMLMSGLMIFNAHSRLYWGIDGANSDHAWLVIDDVGNTGFVEVAGIRADTTGVLGLWTDAGGEVNRRAFPYWATIPSSYDLQAARRWHLTFGWILAVSLLLYMLRSFWNGHISHDLHIRRREWSLRHIGHDIAQHARLRFPTGNDARNYHILQKISYIGVIFVLLPMIILTGLTMSPGMNAAWPWLLDLFGGRQSARSLHFIAMLLLVAFFFVHIAMVILAGPYNEIRSIITGKYTLPGKRHAGNTNKQPSGDVA